MRQLRLPAVLTRDIRWSDFLELGSGFRAFMQSLWWSHDRVVLDWRDGRIHQTSSGGRDATADYLLAVPKDQTLSFDIRPAEGYSRRLDRVVEDNMPVWTPFQADEVWLQRIEPPRTGSKTVEVFYVPRAHLAPAIESANATGLRVDGLLFEGHLSPPLLFDRFGASRRRIVRHAEKIGSAFLVVLAILAGLAGLDRLERMEGQHNAATAQALKALRTIQAPGDRSFDALSEGRRHPHASSALADILIQMPNHSIITDLEWKPDEVTIRLKSEAAAAFREAVQPGKDWTTLETGSGGHGVVTIQYKRERLP